MLKGKNGITLVTLTITIIIMLILAGLIIDATIDDGIIDDAYNTTEQLNNRIAKDEEITAGIIGDIKDELKGGTTTEPTTPPSTPVEGSITLNKSSLTLEIVDGVNTQETLTVTKQNLTGTVNWTSSTPTVATVDSNGKVTTVGVGTATITASCGGKTATCSVTVTTKTTPRVTLSATTGEVEEEGTLVLTASLNVTATQNIVWTSSDNTIATVVGSGTNNRTGTITGVKAGGPVTITAKYGDKTATCSVTVNEKTPALISFTIDGVEYQAEEGMEWYAWCNSSYDVNDYFKCSGTNSATVRYTGPADTDKNVFVEDAAGGKEIIEGYSYEFRYTYSGGSGI